MVPSLSDIFYKRLLIVTGKGGVGKSVTAAALARAAAVSGKNTLVVELGEAERLAELFHAPESHGEIKNLSFRIDGSSCQHDKALERFSLSILKIRFLYQTLIRSKLLKSFFEAMPGLHDLALLNLIWSYLHQGGDNGQKYDLVILDAPAIGHAQSLLRTPYLMKNVVHVGPIRKILNHIDELLNDPATTMLLCVTIAEDLPVTETFEFLETVQRTLTLSIGPLIVNNVWGIDGFKREEEAFNVPETFRQRLAAPDFATWLPESDRRALFDAYRLYQSRHEIQSFHLQRIHDRNQDYLVIPHYEQDEDEYAMVIKIASCFFSPMKLDETSHLIIGCQPDAHI